MKPLNSLTRAWLIAAATCVLAACGGGDGGGGDTPSQPASSAYLGDWVRARAEGCIPTGKVNPATGYQIYMRIMWNISQAAGDDLHSRMGLKYYVDARCTSLLAEFAEVQEEGILRYVGQRVRYLGRVEGTVDRYIYQWIGTTVRDATGAPVQRADDPPTLWQSGQDVSLRVENGALYVYVDAIPDGYWEMFVR